MKKLMIIGLFLLPLLSNGYGGKRKREEKQTQQGRFHKNEYVKPGTIVIVTMKDGTTTRAKVMYARGKNKYWLNQRNGNRFGTCKRKHFQIVSEV